MDSQIILASSSPRRIEMLKSQGIEPVIIPSAVDETLPFEMSMEQSVMYLAMKKALYVERIWIDRPGSEIPAVIIAADTVVYKDGMIGKPENWADAVNTLRLLRNTSHFVATGVALVAPGLRKRCLFYDHTEVFFKDYSDKDIQKYLDTDEPWDKAGGYAIQGAWGKYVARIIGNQENVIGFPWTMIKKELEKNWPEIAS